MVHPRVYAEAIALGAIILISSTVGHGGGIATIGSGSVNQAINYRDDCGFTSRMPSAYLAERPNSSGAGEKPLLITSPRTMRSRPNGIGRISCSFKGSPIVISTSNQYAGAISSLTWNGMQFINSADHGRALQSAVQLDGGGEENNPTEAGSAADGAAQTTTSALRALSVSGNVLRTQTQMAYWKPFNCATISNVILKKKVTVGFAGIPNVIEDAIAFSLPDAHASASFEGLTGYMPPAFSIYSTYAPSTKTLAAIANPATLSEEPLPIIVSTPDRQHAMGSYAHPGLGRYNYAYQAFPGITSKWDCSVSHVEAIPAGDYAFTCYVIVGSLADVQKGIDSVYAYFNSASTPFASIRPQNQR